jgi:hypothetical protein
MINVKRLSSFVLTAEHCIYQHLDLPDQLYTSILVTPLLPRLFGVIMPLRNLYVRGLVGCFELITLRGLNDPEGNVFDKAFNTHSVVMQEWNDWMQWEGGAKAPLLDQKHSFRSTISSQEYWCSDVENVGRDTISTSLTAENEFLFQDAPFVQEETTRASHSLQFGPGSEAFPTTFEAPREGSFRGYSSLPQAEE